MIAVARLCGLLLLVAALHCAVPNAALAGMDVKLEEEYQRINEVRRKIEALPEYQRSEELKQRLSELLARQAELQRSPTSKFSEWAKRDLQRQIDALKRELDSAQKAISNSREALLNHGQGNRYFPGARNRLATFTYDDPHVTGLGDAVSFVLAKKLLFSTRVSSFAIVNYRQETDRDLPRDLAYFDRVDAIIKDQAFRLAVWGNVTRTDRGVRIDSFIQVPEDADKRIYERSVELPEAMGRGRLTARLKPDRVVLQRLDVESSGTGALQAAAERIATLRASPNVSAPITGRIGDGSDGMKYVIVGSQGAWVQLRLDNGHTGWTAVDQFCTAACSPILDVANFVNDVIALPAGLRPRPTAKNLTREADAMLQQMTALMAVSENPNRAVEIAERAVRAGPGGAGFANLLAVARVEAALAQAARASADRHAIRLDRQLIERIANQLADASVDHPGDIEVVQNLAVLFAYLGDDKRRNLALEIAANLRSKAR